MTTLDIEGQRVALEQLGSRCGAVTAFDPRTGKVLVMVSSPSYDPNLVERRYGEIEGITADCTPAAPLLNRASAGLLRPGLDVQGRDHVGGARVEPLRAGSTFVDPGYCTVYGKRVNNFDTSSPFGRITLATALQYSVNSVILRDRKGARCQGDSRPGRQVRLLRAAAARDA